MADGATQPKESLQPHNIEAEQAVLGALLLNNDCFDRIDAMLKPQHFFDPVHGRIYAEAARLIARGNVASPVSLKTHLETDDGLKELGGADYLIRLAGATVSIIAVRDYARVVRDLALRRDLIRIGSEIQDSATRPEPEPPDQIRDAEQSLFELGERGVYEKGFVNFCQAATEAAVAADAAFQRGDKLAGISTGLKDLDDKLGGLRNSDLVVIAGRPSMGKTALATNIAFNIAKRYKHGEKPDGTKGVIDGGVVGFFSLEMSSEQLANRILAAESEIQSHKLMSGQVEEHEFRRFLEAAKGLETLKLFIDDTPALPISSLATRARRLKRTEGMDVMVVDYLQLARPASGKDHGRVTEVSEITQGLKAIAKELDIPVIALSQLSRQVEARDDKRPLLSDLRESGSIEQDADVVMFVYREEYYHERTKPQEDDPSFPEWREKAERLFGHTEIIIGKQRHGPIGTVELYFEGKYTRFTNLARPNQVSPKDDGRDDGFE